MIPALIVPAYSRPDLLDRLVASIDYPVGKLIVVDNSPDGSMGRDDATVLRPVTGLGYPGGINAGIWQTPTLAWWMWASVDIEFGPGDLEAIADGMNSFDVPAVVTGDRTDSRLLRFAYGAINRAAVQAVGLMDEGFYPIYFDDDDYERRCRLGGVEWVEFNGDIGHGDNGQSGSVTIKSDEDAARSNNRTFRLNHQRYVEKWGGSPGSETFTTPWGLPVPLSYWPPDIEGRAARVW